MRWSSTVLATGLLTACGPAGFGDGGAPWTSGESGTTGATSSGASSEGGATEDETGDEGTGSEPKFDVEAADTDEEGDDVDDGCEKVDFLFVVDNSGSMGDKQAALTAAFPGFIDSIRNTVKGKDHHIMVIDSDRGRVAQSCPLGCQPNCNPEKYYCPCGDFPCDTGLDQCDKGLGAGVVRPYGGFASNMDCGISTDARYMTDAEPDLADKFACIATVGVTGSAEELPFSAMVAALGDQQPAAGCNAGFLRDDAILVITIISDDDARPGEDDDALNGDPLEWYDAVVAAKGGTADPVVVIGIGPWGDLSCVWPGNETPNFSDFVEMFGDRGILASVCEPNYAAVFDSAVAVIGEACDQFVPAG